MKHGEMVFRVLVFSLLVSACAFTSAQSLRASPPDLGVVVQSASYDPVKHEIAIRFYNSTRHDVTGYSYSLRIDYVDGTSRLKYRGTELAVDPTYTAFFLRAGSTRDEKLYELPQPTVTRVEGFVDVVAYDDGTAEVVNEAAFDRMVETRKAEQWHRRR